MVWVVRGTWRCRQSDTVFFSEYEFGTIPWPVYFVIRWTWALLSSGFSFWDFTNLFSNGCRRVSFKIILYLYWVSAGTWGLCFSLDGALSRWLLESALRNNLTSPQKQISIDNLVILRAWHHNLFYLPWPCTYRSDGLVEPNMHPTLIVPNSLKTVHVITIWPWRYNSTDIFLGFHSLLISESGSIWIPLLGVTFPLRHSFVIAVGVGARILTRISEEQAFALANCGAWLPF